MNTPQVGISSSVVSIVVTRVRRRTRFSQVASWLRLSATRIGKEFTEERSLQIARETRALIMHVKSTRSATAWRLVGVVAETGCKVQTVAVKRRARGLEPHCLPLSATRLTRRESLDPVKDGEVRRLSAAEEGFRTRYLHRPHGPRPYLNRVSIFEAVSQ